MLLLLKHLRDAEGLTVSQGEAQFRARLSWLAKPRSASNVPGFFFRNITGIRKQFRVGVCCLLGSVGYGRGPFQWRSPRSASSPTCRGFFLGTPHRAAQLFRHALHPDRVPRSRYALPQDGSHCPTGARHGIREAGADVGAISRRLGACPSPPDPHVVTLRQRA